MKRFLLYLTYIILMIVVIKGGLSIQMHLLEEVAVLKVESILYLMYSSIFSIIIGVLFGIPRLITKIRSAQKFTFDWIKFIAIGIPTVYLATVPYLYFTAIGSYLPYASRIYHEFGNFTPTIFGIIFGYVLLDSFIKK
ncbi:hypothetical protein [Bacillus solimangrovi]|uniref:Uncharacterized protein n=1 Tax=Bacillus solimangrovi TaxID=1305675 RepID=A0A1E5LE37_9BACI|nr:hypothetical protein [Bacillus solimangrovi]OEH92336.1 hypothetical protein BFG57_16300 [Bacillus solimangrovi]